MERPKGKNKGKNNAINPQGLVPGGRMEYLLGNGLPPKERKEPSFQDSLRQTYGGAVDSVQSELRTVLENRKPRE